MTDDRGARQYLGTWVLLPELCIYQEGEPPSRGIYSIAQVKNEVEISIAWTATDGSSHDIRFGAPDDGTRRPIAGQARSELVIERISSLILDSTVFMGNRVLAYARRCVSLDGLLLATMQQGYRSDGTAYRNFQVYRRQDGSVG